MFYRILDVTKLQELAESKVQELKLQWRDDFVLNGIAYDSQNDRYRHKNNPNFVKNDFI